MTKTLLVCCGTGCVASGALQVLQALKDAACGLDVEVQPQYKATGCHGFCEQGPIVRVMPDDVSYYKVQPKDAAEIIDKTVVHGQLVDRLLYLDDEGHRVSAQADNPFFRSQKKQVLANVGLIDPCEIDDYLARGGYEGLKKALAQGGSWVIEQMAASGLRGRGGAGFSTASKWKIGRAQEAEHKFVVCNGDEGDPGAFMDGALLDGDPHRVLEGLTIAAIAVGADHGFLYIRDEYSQALNHIELATVVARQRGYLGKNILNSGFDFDVEIVRGGGAFVCGEETALIESMEGRVGEPRFKPPYPSVSGLWGFPTVINNVETLGNIPLIINEGGAEFARLGTDNSTGTKIFAMVGKVRRTGLVEIPMGTTLRQLVFEVGGGVAGGRNFKAVQTGGPSGGCLPEDMLDLPVDYNQLTSHGSMMGSGGIIVMDDRTCMVEFARYYVRFLSEESCGRCTSCREGLRQMLNIYDRICAGQGKEEDLAELESIAVAMKEASICALGKTSSNPVLTTLRYFRNEYEEHIKNKHCPAGVCTALVKFAIDKDKCKGCGQCARECPAKAISGQPKQAYVINDEKCIRCGACRNKCNFDAVITGKRGES